MKRLILWCNLTYRRADEGVEMSRGNQEKPQHYKDGVDRRSVVKGAAAAAGVAALSASPSYAGSLANLASSEAFSLSSGEVITPDSHEYEIWRKAMLWQNRKPERSPDYIVRPETDQDIVDTITYARASGKKVAIKSGGHNLWGNFLRDDGILLDMWNYRNVQVDTEAKRARVQPALWARNLMDHLLPYDLAFPVAHCATTPLGGYLLGGGLGLNWESWGGMSAASIVGAHVITAEAERVYIDEKNHPDLFWALRGAGNGFPALVTEFDIQLYSAPKSIDVSFYMFPITMLPDVAAWVESFGGALPETERMILLTHNPQAPADAAPEAQKICVARFAAFTQTKEEGDEILRRVAESNMAQQAIFKNEYQASNFEQLFIESIDAKMGFGFGRFGVDNIWASRTEEVMRVLRDEFVKALSHKSHTVISFADQPLNIPNAAFSVSGPVYVGTYAVWDEAENDEGNIAWLRALMTSLQPFSEGSYINEIDVEGAPHKLRECFSAEAWERLRQVRQTYDPDGIFHDFFGI